MKDSSKRKSIIIIVVLCSLWVAGFAFFTSFLPEEDLPRYSLFFSSVLGMGSFLVSITALLVSVLTMQKSEKERLKRIDELTDKFIQDNNEEIDYIPLCIMVSISV